MLFTTIIPSPGSFIPRSLKFWPAVYFRCLWGGLLQEEVEEKEALKILSDSVPRTSPSGSLDPRVKRTARVFCLGLPQQRDNPTSLLMPLTLNPCAVPWGKWTGGDRVFSGLGLLLKPSLQVVRAFILILLAPCFDRPLWQQAVPLSFSAQPSS